MKTVKPQIWRLLLVILAGCTPVTTTLPLSDPRSSQPDERLLGRWVVVESINGIRDEIPDAYVQVTRCSPQLPNAPAYMYEARTVEYTPDGPAASGEFYFFPSSLNDHTFVNAIEKEAVGTDDELGLQLEKASKGDGDSSPLRWTLFRYELKGDELVILGDSYTETLHGPRESLREFIGAYGDRIFTRGVRLKRTQER